jgi:hypothetical protein
MKGKNVEAELCTSKLLGNLGLGAIELERYMLPASDINHAVVAIKKVSGTAGKYPRRGKRLGTE